MNNPNNQEVHHRNGDKYGSEMRSHKLAMERDFPVAVSKFRIGVLKRAIATEKCLDNVKKHSEKLANIQEKLKPFKKQEDKRVLDSVGVMMEMSQEEREENYPSQRDVE